MCRKELPKHMVYKHKWPKAKAKVVNQMTNQRRLPSTNPKLAGRRRVKCDQEGCHSIVFCLRDHYRKKHIKLLIPKEKVSVLSETFYHQDRNEEVVESTQETTDSMHIENVENILLDTIDESTLVPYEPSSDDAPMLSEYFISKEF